MRCSFSTLREEQSFDEGQCLQFVSVCAKETCENEDQAIVQTAHVTKHHQSVIDDSLLNCDIARNLEL